MSNIVEYFQEGDKGFWSNFVFIDRKRKFECHCMEDGGFEAVDFGKARGHINDIFCFSIGSHGVGVHESVMKEKWRYFERTWKEEEEEWMFLKQTKCKKFDNDDRSTIETGAKVYHIWVLAFNVFKVSCSNSFYALYLFLYVV